MFNPYQIFLFLSIFFLAGCNQEIQTADITRHLSDHPEIIFDALRSNPDQLLTVMGETLAYQENLVQKARIEENVASPYYPLVQPEKGIMGGEDSPNVAVLYADLLSPEMKEMYQTVKNLSAEHPGKVRVYLKHLPRTSTGELAAVAFEVLLEKNPEAAIRFLRGVIENRPSIVGNNQFIYKMLEQEGIDKDALQQGAIDLQVGAMFREMAGEGDKFEIRASAMMFNGVVLYGQQVGLVDKALSGTGPLAKTVNL